MIYGISLVNVFLTYSYMVGDGPVDPTVNVTIEIYLWCKALSRATTKRKGETYIHVLFYSVYFVLKIQESLLAKS